MQIESIVILIVAVVSAILSAVTLFMVIKGKGNQNTDLTNDIDMINQNLRDVVNMVNENTAVKVDNLKEVLTVKSSADSEHMAKTLEFNINSLKQQVKELEQRVEKSLAEIKKSEEDNRNGVWQTLGEVRKEFKQTTEDMRVVVDNNIKTFREETKSSIGDMRKSVSDQLREVREDNNKQLAQMRETVDEKLTTTLDTRVQNAFKQVSERLEAVQRGFGEMKELSDRVGNLNKVFNNVKTRGTWGEVALESLLEQILAPEQYKTQFMLTKNSKDRVDFAIVMPGQAGETVYLPIDAKFPISDYEKLVEASESGNSDLVAIARKALYDRVKSEAKDIRDKYIKVPHTTNFAIMYVPNEGIYAEIMRNAQFSSMLQSDYRVTVCGPSTIAALLNSLQTGFTTLKIQKRSGEIIKQMRGIREDFGKFTTLISKVKEKAQGVVETIDKIDKRNDLLNKKLSKVGGDLPGLEQQENSVLEIAATIDEGGEDES